MGVLESGQPSVVLITGAMASGKSSVAQALAERLPSAAHVRGDGFRRSIVSGRAAMTDPLSAEALSQLGLRHRLAAQTADTYAQAGITAVVQDLYLGDDLPAMVERIAHRPLFVVVLAPQAEAIRRREAGRGKSGYAGWSVEGFADAVRDTPMIGLRIDTSDLTVAETVDAILDRQDAAVID